MTAPDRDERIVDDPEQVVIDAERNERLADLLGILGPRQIEILTLRIAVGLSAEETADALGSTPGAVRVAQHRAGVVVDLGGVWCGLSDGRRYVFGGIAGSSLCATLLLLAVAACESLRRRGYDAVCLWLGWSNARVGRHDCALCRG